MADQIRATPQNATLGAIANFLKQTYAPQRTQQMQGVMELLGVPALARTAERMSYGEPVTNINKANVPLLPADTAEAAMLAGPPLASMARRVGTNLVQTAPYVARDLAQSMTSPMRSYVVKPKGGNWLAGSVERAVEPMRARFDMGAGLRVDPATINREGLDARQLEMLAPTDAMNRWLETKLGKYIKNEMATPEDPLRALAESFPAKQADQLALKDAQIAKAIADLERAQAQRGVAPEMLTSSQARLRDLRRERQFIADQTGLHAEIGPTGYSLKGPRAMAGFPEEGVGVSPLAKTWEDRADTFINQLHASDLTRGYPEAVEANPWLAKVPPETRVYEMLSGAEEDLGFRHLADELRNAINPASGLPENLLLKYQDLEKLSVPQAAQRVSEINAWRAGQKADADLARASNIATQVFKEYPDSPQGLRWVELRQPKETGRKISVEKSEMDLPPDMDQRQMREVAEDMAFDEGLDEGTQAFDDFVRDMMTDFNRKKKVEMDESYKALEDALKYEGEVLQHCVGGYCPDVVEGRSRIFSLRDEKGQPYVTIETTPSGNNSIKSLKENSPQNFDIVQIKGKKNQAPASEYLPYVQDFVRSGNWSKVGDLQNTGLISYKGEYRLPEEFLYRTDEGGWEPLVDVAKRAFPDSPAKQLNFYRGASELENDIKLKPQGEGFAEGGLVGGANFPTYDFDPARIDSIVGELHAMNAG